MRHRSGLLLFPGSEPERTASPVAPSAAPASPLAGGARYLLVHLPAFALERCGHAADDLAICVAEQRGATRVVALTPAAHHEGVRLGMALPQARALVPDLLVQPHDPAAERADHAELLPCFAHLGERLATWGEHDILVEITHTAHLLGGESGAIAAARARAAELGHRARVVVADDPCAALAIAEYGDGDRAVPPSQGAAALAPLPFVALRPSGELHAAARAIGVQTLGQWAAFEPASIAGRFGAEGLRLLHLARGRAVTRLPWSDPPAEPLIERVVLGGPTLTLDPILFVLPGLVRRLSERLLAQGLAASRLAVRLALERGPPHVVRVRVGEPARDPERLLALLRARLERVRLGAPALELALEVLDHAPERAWQPGLLQRTAAAEPVADLLARLADTLGESCVFSPYQVESWVPERAVGRRPFVPGARPPAPPIHRKCDRDPVAIQRAHEPSAPRPRPLILLASPERVQVQAPPGGPPRQLRLDGRWCPIHRAQGPERIETGWWEVDGGVTRDYWVVAIDERAAWCFVDDRGAWWLHGWFD